MNACTRRHQYAFRCKGGGAGIYWIYDGSRTDTACTALRQTLRFIGVPAEAVQALRIETFESFSASVLRAILSSTAASTSHSATTRTPGSLR